MTVCALCHQNEADKKGSHLVPHFLLKMIDNIDGRTGRDLDLGFQLGPGQVKGYFGRSVQPEKLDSVFGERTDEENENSRTNLIVDHFLCTRCEKRLAEIESSYSDTLNVTDDALYQTTSKCLMATLFWISIFWRMSASNSTGFKLNEIDEHHLRIILDGGMSVEDISTYVAKLGNEITGITYKLIRSKDFTINHNGFLFFDSKEQIPYCALIGEYAIFLSVNKPVEFVAEQNFLGLELYAKKTQLNNCEQGEWILPVPHEVFDEAVNAVTLIYAKDFTKRLNESLDQLHAHFIGYGVMDIIIKKEILNAITEDAAPLGRKYTPEAITDATIKILLQHEPYKSIGERLNNI